MIRVLVQNFMGTLDAGKLVEKCESVRYAARFREDSSGDTMTKVSNFLTGTTFS